jgi:C-terminal processing protease CtpA/Prc
MAFLGVQTAPLTPEAKSRVGVGVGVDEGVVVTEVLPDTPAARAGLRVDDVITTMDDKAMTDPERLREAIGNAGVGKEVHLKVARGKETKELTAKLEQAPADIGMMPPGGIRPGGFGTPAPLPGMIDLPQRVQELERRVAELERQLRELEQRQAQPPVRK